MNLKSRGFSIIEVAIYILIISILVVSGTFVSNKWIKQSQMDQSILAFASAVTIARTTAMKNQTALADYEVSSRICFDLDSMVLSVHKARSMFLASCSTPMVYRYDIPKGMQILNTNFSDFSCMAFDALGRVTDQATECTSIGAVVVKIGDMQDEYNIN